MVAIIPQITEQKPCDGSFVRVPSVKLTERARQTLENIKAYKQHDLKKLIASEKKEILKQRDSRRNSLWTKLFGYTEPPMPTDEEIIKIHEQNGDGIWLPETVWINYRYSEYEETARRLLNAAQYADEVAVSTKDLAKLI